MSKLSCHIKIGEVPLHLYQILGGFLLLKRQGIIELTIEKLTLNQEKLPYNMLEVIVNNEILILYDLNDGYDNLLQEQQSYISFMDGLLDRYDFCFKRSFSTKYNSKLKNKNKVFPLGLNYMVTIPGNVAHYPSLHDPLKERLKKLVRMLPFSEFYNGLYFLDSFENIPLKDKDPKVLFMARLWDIEGDNGLTLPKKKKEERIFINEQRAKCIRLCTKEFGDKFFGGISPSKFALENYPELVVDNRDITKRNNYLRKVKESSVCIATTGLHESIGWKFAEYVAASKAIVSEKLSYEIPGGMKTGENYLEFNSPEQCVAQVHRLLNDDELRYRLMVNNYQYYHQFVRADKLVLNSLLSVISNGVENSETNSNSVYAYL